MFEVITIGSALVDIFVSSADLHIQPSQKGTMLCEAYGEKLEMDSLAVATGGAGTNTGVGFQRLGWQTAVVAELGSDPFAEVVVADLEKEHVSVKLLIKERREQTGGSVILVGSDGGRTVFVHRGAAAQLDESDIPAVVLSRARWLHVSSIAAQIPALKRVFATARQHSVGVSWNPGAPELRWIAEHGLSELGLTCDILLLNKEEWQMIEQFHDQLKQTIAEIVITDGRHGGEVWCRGKAPVTYQAAEVVSVDDTGAGDAFAVGYVGARLLEKPVTTATSWGVANAASVVQKVGAKPGLLTRRELERM